MKKEDRIRRYDGCGPDQHRGDRVRPTEVEKISTRRLREGRKEEPHSIISGVHTDALLVEASRDLDVCGRSHELNALEGPSRHDTGAMSGLAAVTVNDRELYSRSEGHDCDSRNNLTLDVADLGTGNGRTPQTKVYEIR